MRYQTQVIWPPFKGKAYKVVDTSTDTSVGLYRTPTGAERRAKQLNAAPLEPVAVPDNPACARCYRPHKLTMADLVEQDPALPVYCRSCESTVCDRCGQFGAPTRDLAAPAVHRVCDSCRNVDREPQGEAMRLFAPAPNQIPGQLTIG